MRACAPTTSTPGRPIRLTVLLGLAGTQAYFAVDVFDAGFDRAAAILVGGFFAKRLLLYL